MSKSVHVCLFVCLTVSVRLSVHALSQSLVSMSCLLSASLVSDLYSLSLPFCVCEDVTIRDYMALDYGPWPPGQESSLFLPASWSCESRMRRRRGLQGRGWGLGVQSLVFLPVGGVHVNLWALLCPLWVHASVAGDHYKPTLRESYGR